MVLELFTSEGCSSCPPADALALKLETTQPFDGTNIIAIEEHVDYWNHEGWMDRYSSHEWTERQLNYVELFKEKSAFTPEIVIDGQKQLVGSRESEIRQLIVAEASRPKTDVSIIAEGTAPDGAPQFKVQVGKLQGHDDRDHAEVWLAITEKDLKTSVSGGENAGKNLVHAPVLRSLHKIGVANPKTEAPFDFEISTRVKLQPNWERQNLQVVAFVQEKKSLRILGAATSGIAK